MSAAQLLWELYDRTGLLGIFGSMAGGQRRQENLLAFYQYTRSCQSRGHAGLFDFVRDLRRVLEQGNKLPGVPGRQGRGVQIMSIHKSKGLEFPVVVLAGLSRKCNKADEMAPMLFHPKLGVGPKGLDPELRVEFPTLARQRQREERLLRDLGLGAQSGTSSPDTKDAVTEAAEETDA